MAGFNQRRDDEGALVRRLLDTEKRLANLERRKVGAWLTPTLLNSWTQYASSTTRGYFKDPVGVVHLRGRLVTTGASGTTAFQLPAGYRSDSSYPRFALPAANGTTPVAAFVIIDPSGNVNITYASGATDVSINGVTFLAEN